MKLFGREWTLWTAAIAGLLQFFVGFGWDSLSAGQAAWINTAIGAVAGIVVAVKTRPVAPQAFTYALTSLAGLLAAYGMDLSQTMVTDANLLVLAFLALLTRAQVSPTSDAPLTGVLGDPVVTATSGSAGRLLG
jgi:hypothetical protein